MVSMSSVLSESSLKKLLTRLGREQLHCEVCGKELRPGDHIHRIGKTMIKGNQWGDLVSNPHCRFYHEECFQSLYIEL